MSLLSTDTVHLYVSPRRVQAVKTGGWSKRVLASLCVDVPAHAPNDMQTLLRTCAQVASELPGGDIRVVLSDSLVRYQCFAWRPKLRNAQEDLAFAAMAFDDVYGASASAHWQLTFNNAPPGIARLCAAVPKGLFNGLHGVKEGPLRRVVSVTGALCAVVQAYRGLLPASGWVVSEDGDRISMGSWNAAGWSWLQTVRATLTQPQDMVDLIFQEMQLASVSLNKTHALPVLIHSPTLAQRQLPSTDGMRLIMVQPALPDAKLGASNVDPVGFAYAMLGRLA